MKESIFVYAEDLLTRKKCFLETATTIQWWAVVKIED
jgi:hypothetical protein